MAKYTEDDRLQDRLGANKMAYEMEVEYNNTKLRRRIVARHKHADLIHAWADGVQVQVHDYGKWIDTPHPLWLIACEYRVKPQPKPDYVLYDSVSPSSIGRHLTSPANVRFTFDGETGALKSAEVLK